MTDVFQVKHKRTGETKMASKETDEGFMWFVPFYPIVGTNGPPAYLLKKPYWERVGSPEVRNDFHL